MMEVSITRLSWQEAPLDCTDYISNQAISALRSTQTDDPEQISMSHKGYVTHLAKSWWIKMGNQAGVNKEKSSF